MPKRVINSVAEIFGALSNPIRLQIIILLSEGEKDVKEIHERLELSSSNVSQHLAILRTHHLVELRKEGTHIFYKLHTNKAIDVIRKALELFELELSEAEAIREVIDKVWV